MSVYKKLQQARVELQKVKMVKTGFNSFSKYSYFDLCDFMPHVVSIFNNVGLCGVVSFTEALASLKIFDVDTGESVEFTSPMSSADLKGCHRVQNVGAVETYQRRYLYVTAMDIVEHDAIDSSGPLTQEKKKTLADKWIPVIHETKSIESADSIWGKASGECEAEKDRESYKLIRAALVAHKESLK